MRAVGHDRPVVGDALDQLDDVAALDVVDNAAAPNRQHDVIEDVDGLPPAVLARLLLGVALDEVGGPLVDGVGRTRGAAFSALALASNFRAAGSRPCASSCSASVAALRAAASVSARSRVSFFGRPSYR